MGNKWSAFGSAPSIVAFEPVTGMPVYTGRKLHTSAMDIPITLFWGARRITPNLIWWGQYPRGQGNVGLELPLYTDFKSSPLAAHNYVQIHNGGTNFSGGLKVETPSAPGTYTEYPPNFDINDNKTWVFFIPCLFALGEGPIDSCNGGWDGQSTKTLNNFNVFYGLQAGSSTQAVWDFWATFDPLIDHWFVQGRIPYRNVALMGSYFVQCDAQGHIPQQSFLCIRTPNPAYAVTEADGSTDYSLADIIPDFLTNTRYGMGLTSADIDATSLLFFKQYQFAQGLYFSPMLVGQNKAMDIVDRWAVIANTWIFWDGTLIRFVPLGDVALTANGQTYTPDLAPAYALGMRDFIGDVPVTVTRADPADCYNRLVIQITDNALSYSSNPVEWKDQGLIDQYGVRDASSVQGDDICCIAVGKIVVNLAGRRLAYIRKTYEFTLSYRYIRLLPGTVVSLTEPNIGLTAELVRIRSIEEDEKGFLKVLAEELPGTTGISTTQGHQPGGSGTIDQYADPGFINTPAIIEPSSALFGRAPPQVWLAASGAGAHWGGCVVFFSADNVTFSQIGRLLAPAAQGLLTSILPTHADPDAADTLALDLTESHGILQSITTVTHADADSARTLSVVAAQPTGTNPLLMPNTWELVSYGTVTLSSAYNENLTYLRRGWFGSTISSHAIGEQFTKLDGTALHWVLQPQYIGATIYFKFCSFNQYGNSQQALSAIPSYQYTPVGTGFGTGTAGVPIVPLGLAAVGGVGQIAVSWTANPTSDNVTSYTLYAAPGLGASFGSATVLWTGLATSYIHSGLGNGVSFTYFLVATNAIGPSAHTAGVGATTLTTGGSVITPRFVLDLRSFAPVQPRQVQAADGYTSVSDGGEGMFQWDAIDTRPDDGGDIIKYAGLATGRWARVVEAALINVRHYGATGLGVADDAPAFTLAMSAAASAAITSPAGICDVVVPGGTYVFQTMVSVPPRIRIKGNGHFGNSVTKIVAGGSFAAAALFDLQTDSLAATSHYQSEIAGMHIVAGTNNSGIAAIQCVQPFMTNCYIHHLTLTGGIGLQFGSHYSQLCVIEDIYGAGTCDQLIKLAGNVNTLRRLDTTGVTASRSTSMLPVVHLANGTLGNIGNIVEQCVIEGNIGLSQTPLRADNAYSLTIFNFWVEDPSGGNGHWAEFVNCGPIRVIGSLQNVGATSGGGGGTFVLYARTTQSVFIESFRNPAQDVSFQSFFDFDSTPLRIQQATLGYGDDTYKIIRFDNTVPFFEIEGATMVNAGLVTNLVGQQRVDMGMRHNLLTNPSFDAGLYGWTVAGASGESDIFQAGTVGPGQGWHTPFNANPSSHITVTQSIVINSAQLHVPMTFSIKAQIGSSASSRCNIWIDGCGITGTSLTDHVQRIGGNQGWSILTQSFTPTSAGTLQVGIEIPQSSWTTGDVLWLDEANLSFGLVGHCNQPYAGSFAFASGDGGDGAAILHLYGSAAPTTGTWPAGAIVWNNAAGAILGWRCTAAGSPGTWAAITAATFPITGVDVEGVDNSHIYVQSLSGNAGAGGAIPLVSTGWLGLSNTASTVYAKIGASAFLSLDASSNATITAPTTRLKLATSGGAAWDALQGGIQQQAAADFSILYAATTASPGQSINLQPQASTGSFSGSVNALLSVPGAGTTEASFGVYRAGTALWRMQSLPGTPTSSVIYSGVALPGLTNYVFAQDSGGGGIVINDGGSGNIDLAFGGVLAAALSTAQFEWSIPFEGLGIPFPWGATSVALGGGGTITLTPSQYQCRWITLTGTAPGGTIVLFPNLQNECIVDAAGATVGGGVTLKSGTGTRVITNETYTVYTDGGNGIHVDQFT